MHLGIGHIEIQSVFNVYDFEDVQHLKINSKYFTLIHDECHPQRDQKAQFSEFVKSFIAFFGQFLHNVLKVNFFLQIFPCENNTYVVVYGRYKKAFGQEGEQQHSEQDKVRDTLKMGETSVRNCPKGASDVHKLEGKPDEDVKGEVSIELVNPKANFAVLLQKTPQIIVQNIAASNP